MTNTLIDALFASDLWANQQLLAVCRSIAQKQFESPIDIGHGSLAATIDHIISTTFFFADRLNRAEPSSRYDPQSHNWTAAELTPIFEQAHHELRMAIAQALQVHALTDLLNWTDTDDQEVDELDRVTYAVALAQMIDHSIHHRTQAMAILRQLGVQVPTDWHPFAWDEAIRTLGE